MPDDVINYDNLHRMFSEYLEQLQEDEWPEAARVLDAFLLATFDEGWTVKSVIKDRRSETVRITRHGLQEIAEDELKRRVRNAVSGEDLFLRAPVSEIVMQYYQGEERCSS